MDSDQHNQDGPAKPMNGCNSSEIIKSDQESKDIQEVKEKSKRKSRKGSLKTAARNLCRIKFFKSISPVKLMCRCQDLYAQNYAQLQLRSRRHYCLHLAGIGRQDSPGFTSRKFI